MHDLVAPTTGLPTAGGKRLIAAIAAATAVALMAVVLLVPPGASARTEFSWKSNYQGIAYGWDGNHGWMIGSYSAVGSVGAGEIASLVCGAVIGEEGPLIGKVCSAPIQALVSQLTKGSARLSNHGIWIEAYPKLFPLTITFRSGRW